jgi:IS30 family transposase
MPKKYKRISEKDRFIIYQLLVEKKSFSEIALAINKNISSIRREINRCPKGKYSIHDSLHQAISNSSNRAYRKTKISKNINLEKFVLEKLNLRWSPEQIHLNLLRHYPNNKTMQISTESIYFYIYVHCKPELKKEYIQNLRQKRKYRGNVRRGKDKRTTIKDPIRIDERPEEVKGRIIPGHWEGDLVMGKDRQSAIATLNERTTRTVIIMPLKNRDAASVRIAFEKEFKKLPTVMKKTLTYDNGSEMAQHKLFTKNTKVQVYFAHPYSPWERPTNENSNGLIRDFFPKGTDFSKVSKKELKKVQDLLNERPRKVLDGRTPNEVFEEMILQKISKENLQKAAM